MMKTRFFLIHAWQSHIVKAFAVKTPLSLHFLQYISFLKAAGLDAVSPIAVSASSSGMIISWSESSVLELSGFLEACAINIRLSLFHFTFIVYLFWFLNVVGVIAVAPVMGGLPGRFSLGVWGELQDVVSKDIDGLSPLNSFTAFWWYFFLSTSLRVLWPSFSGFLPLFLVLFWNGIVPKQQKQYDTASNEIQYPWVGQVNYQHNANITNILSVTAPFTKMWLRPLLITRSQLLLLITRWIINNNFTSPYNIQSTCSAIVEYNWVKWWQCSWCNCAERDVCWLRILCVIIRNKITWGANVSWQISMLKISLKIQKSFVTRL